MASPVTPLYIDSSNDLGVIPSPTAGYFLKRNDAGTAFEWAVAGGTTTVISPSQITSNQNDYTPTSWSTANVVRLDTNALRTVTGFGAATVLLKTVIYIGSTGLILSHQDSSSSAPNRLIVQGSESITLFPDDALTIFLDVSTNRWRVVG